MTFHPLTSRPFSLRRLVLTLSTFATLCMLLANPQSSRAQSENPQKLRTVMKQMMYTDVRQAAPILTLLGVQFELAPQMSTIVLRSADQHTLETALEVLDNLDAPRHDVELTVFILSGSKESPQQGKLSEDLRKVTEKLGQLFDYRGFTLLDTIILRTKDGSSARVDGSLRQGSEGSSLYSLNFRRVKWVPQELSSDPEAAQKGNSVRFDGLSFRLESDSASPDSTKVSAALQTDIEVREGQKAVLGKATPAGSDGALILVVEAQAVSQE